LTPPQGAYWSNRSGATLTYPQALGALEARGRFGVRLGLGRTRALLAELGHPERSFRGALIAGTNGKGSVLALTGAALMAAGLRTGLTPKPHLATYRERLQIDGAPVDEREFTRLVDEVLALANRVARRHGEPTEFELLTAITFRWFGEAGIDLAVVEIGLGGRLDATHAWDGGVAVVTNVALDHMDRLGPTVEAIAREKAAIIMPGDRAVTGAAGGALGVIERRARRVAAPLSLVGPAPLLRLDRDGIEVEVGRLGRVRVGLRGRHQAANVAVADATLDALEAAGIARVPPNARRAGYGAVRWPGRLELIEADGRDVLIDGAHNPAGAAALAQALDDLAPFLAPGRPTLVVAIMADKDVDGVLEALAGAAMLARARVICTAPSGDRALPPDQLAARWQAAADRRGITARRAEVAADPAAAVEMALAAGNGPLVVAGSLYLVGAVRSLLVDDPLLAPDPPAQLPPAGPAAAP
jgi:dihydrofolate synthase/folylpolyglutamate synthase